MCILTVEKHWARGWSRRRLVYSFKKIDSFCITVSGECVPLGSVSSQQRFRVMDIKALGVSQLSGLRQTVL